MKISEGFFIAVIAAGGAVVGAIAGAYVAGSYAKDAADAQAEAQREIMRSGAALKLMEYRSQPMGDIYSANSKLQVAEVGEEMDKAAVQLAMAAAIGAARIDGDAGKLCAEIQDLANDFSRTPYRQVTVKIPQRGDLAAKVAELKHAFEKIQKESLDIAMGNAIRK